MTSAKFIASTKHATPTWSARLLGWLIETGRTSITSAEAFRATDEHRVPDVAIHLIDLEERGLLRRTESDLGGPTRYTVPPQFHRGIAVRVKAEQWLEGMSDLLPTRPDKKSEDHTPDFTARSSRA